MPGPLDGIRVIDLSNMISGPVATQTLADQGADVIKVEAPPLGDLTRWMGIGRDGLSATYLSANRNKRSVVLNLKEERGKELLKQLIATADVFVQNFRPGTADRMGIGEADLRALKPDLIYVSISGFGEKGPYAGKRVYDPVIQALSGLATIQRDRETGRPRMVRTIVPDKLTAITAAQAITAALFHRERHGEGQHVKLAMLDAMVGFLWPEGLVALTFPGGEEKVARAQLAQDLIYETADGYITTGAVSDSEWEGLCNALGKPEWLTDERFNSPAKRVANAAARLEQTQEVLRTQPSAHWLKVLDEHDVPCAPIVSFTELLEHEQIRVKDLIHEYDHEHAGTIRQPRPAALFDRTPADIRRQGVKLGECTREVLLEMGLEAADIDVLAEKGVVG